MARDTYTKVTYFRTALDPLDVYRLDDIINHGGEDDTTTPAAALATHLRGLNPSVRWHVPGDLEEAFAPRYHAASDGVVSLAGKAHMDAAVFSRAGHCTIIVALRSVFGFAFSARSMWFPGKCDAVGLPRATTTGIAYSGSSCLYVPEDTDPAGYIAGVHDPIPWLTKMDFVPSHGSNRAVEATPSVPEGFSPVSWDGPEWLIPRLRSPGISALADSAPLEFAAKTSLVSSIYQGPGIPGFVVVSTG